MEKLQHEFLLEFVERKKEIEYLLERHKPIQNFSIMLFTKLYLGINYLIFLLPTVILPLGRSFVNEIVFYIKKIIINK